MIRDLYNNKEKFERRYRIDILESKTISAGNKALLIDYFLLLKAEGLSAGRLAKYLNILTKIREWEIKDYEKLTKDDLIELAGIIKSKGYTQQTTKDYLITVKKMFKTLTVKEKYAHLEPIYQWLYDKRNKFFKLTIDHAKERNKEQWFTEEDVSNMLNAAGKVRDRCLLGLIAFQGLRPSEALTIRKKDIEKIERGIQIRVVGKTGVRDLFIYEGFLLQNIADYIQRLDDEEYLFDFSIARANHIVKNCCEKAGIKKRAYTYKLRKFSVTNDRIMGLSAGAMEQKYGWVKGSNTVAVYDKSVSKDYRREIQKRYGIVKEDEFKSKFIDKICLRCGEQNKFDQEYCCKCGLRLDITKEELIRDKTAITDRMEKLEKAFEYLVERLGIERIEREVLIENPPSRR